MSVATLSTEELGAFAAACVRSKAADLPTACKAAERIAAGNRRAFERQYSELIEPITADDVERSALYYLSNDPAELARRSFGPLVYNMVSNDGTTFDQDGSVGVTVETVDDLRELETLATKWQEGQARELQRAEEDAEAFDTVNSLPRLTGEQLAAKCKAAKCDRVIYAAFNVDQSDSQSDYHGGRTARTVVIGFGKGKRENFQQLRKAAATFAPTAEFGPDRGIFRPRVVFANDVRGNGCHHYKGSFSPWHSELTGPTYDPVEFQTKAEAEAFIAEKGQPEPVKSGDQLAEFEWKIQETSLEHRENYSMGGGNYLGRGRYSGWKVSSYSAEWTRDGMEYHEPPKATRAARPRQKFDPTGVSVMSQAAAVSDAPPVSCEVQKHYHTKRECPFWIVVLSETVDRDRFEDLRDAAKTAGGWYSRKWGATPGGFAFLDQSEAENFAAFVQDGGKADNAPAAPLTDDKPKLAKAAKNPAERLRGYAEKLERDAEGLRAPRQENTPKRQHQASSARCQAQNHENAATAFRALADGWDSGELPELCEGYTSKAAVVKATTEKTNAANCGYYQTFSSSGEFHDQSPEAVALREFAGLVMTPERQRADALAAKVNALRFANIPGFFPTPDEVAELVIESADIREGLQVLEPSAGLGTLADLARDAGGVVSCVECNYSLVEILELKGHTAERGDFMACNIPLLGFDRVVMNPPFENSQDIAHVQRAFELLKPGGRLAAVMSEGSFGRTGKTETAFREWLDELGAEVEKLPEGSFKSAFRSTGVSTRLVVIDKPGSVFSDAV